MVATDPDLGSCRSGLGHDGVIRVPEIQTMGNSLFSIYALCDPDGAVRYVGAATDVERRFKQHCRFGDNKGTTHRNRWLCSLLVAGNKPSLLILEEGLPDYHDAERRWIAHYKEAGADLVNGNEGGRTLSHAQAALKSNKVRGKRSALAQRLSLLARTPNDLRRIGHYEAAARTEATYRRIVARLAQARKDKVYSLVEARFEALYG